jgi:tetratricopeptide (TPR) repeat protein
MPRPPEDSRATTAGKWLLAFVIVASALALGSVMTEVLVVMSALAAVACALLWIERDDRSSSRASQWVLVALALLLGMTVLQALPLPSAVTHWLTPANADSWDRALSPLREPGPAWHSLSLAPAATRVEVLRGFFYGCVFLGALRVAVREEGDVFLIRLIVFSTCVMAFSALAHMAVGAEKVFGVYRPRELYAYRAGHLAPLLNLNHLAAYLDIGACVAIGAVIDRRSMPRPLAASVAIVLAGTSVWQGSRGAIGALLVGVVLTIGMSLYTTRRFDAARVRAAVLALCAAAAAITVSLSLSEVARERLLSRDLIKLAVARMSVPLVTASPWFGVGRGAFESMFSSVREGAVYDTFTHPEDVIVQWFVEWGVPVSLAGAALLGWALRPRIVLRAVHPAIGVWVAIVVAVLHDLVDFHLEVPGVVALVAVCVAIVVSARAGSRRSGSSPERKRARSPMRFAAVAVVAGTGLAIVAAWRDVGHSLAEDRRALSAMAVDMTISPAQFRAAVRDTVLRYPHEPFFPLMGAVRAQTADDGTVVAWVARALELNPRFGRAHFVLARSLARGHAAQARLEYRLAFENDEALRDPIVREGARLIVDADSALEMVPQGKSGIAMLEALVVALAPRLPATAVILDAELERRSPTTTEPLRRRIKASAADAADGAVWCAEKRCIADGLRDAELLAKREPYKCASHILVATLLAANGEAKRAADGLERSLDVVTDRAECQRELIALSLRTGQTRRGELALEQIVRGGCGAAAECVELYTWAGGVEESRGQYVLAVRLYKRVLEIVPDRDDLLEHIGSLGTRHGVLADALEAYGVLATRHPADPRWLARIVELRAAAAPPPPVLAP